MGSLRLSAPLPVSLVLHLCVLGVVCLSCTDALAGLKPADASGLTGYYLWMAVGGLAGSLVVGWVLPAVAKSLVEYPLFLAVTALSAGWIRGRGRGSGFMPAGLKMPAAAAVLILSLTLVPWAAGHFLKARGALAGMLLVPVAVPAFLSLRAVSGRPVAVGLLLLCFALLMPWTESLAAGSSTVLRLRNYYGIYRVFDRENLRYLQHGTTQHGREYLTGPVRGTPLSYHHPSTPGGRAMSLPDLRKNRVHMIGLGTGAMAAYMGAGSELTVFELDPDNIPIARRYFSYIDDALRRGAAVRFVVGDGRVRLCSRPDGECDALVVDAFSSGSIPVHLLTVEALREYARVISPDGLLLMHVSNRCLALQPVVAANAAAAGLEALVATNAGNVDPDADLTEWVAVFRPGNDRLRGLLMRDGWLEPPPPLPRPWTDRYANIAAAWLGFGR
jgi:SAM-dependent methyltransferase